MQTKKEEDKFNIQMQLVKDLLINAQEVVKHTEELIKTINDKGIDNYYSINSTIFEKATNVYKISAVLGFINTFNLNLPLSAEEKDTDANNKWSQTRLQRRFNSTQA